MGSPEEMDWRERSFALLIGINNYQHAGGMLHPLRCAVNDVQRFAEILRGPGFFLPGNIFCLTEHQATNDTFNDTVEQLQEEVRKFRNQRPDSPLRFLFYFAGHGLVARGVNTPIETYLALRDTKPNQAFRSALKWAELDHIIRNQICPTQDIRILDCCRAELVRGSRGLSSDDSPLKHIVQAQAASGQCFLFSCGRDELAWEPPAGQGHHSYFAEALLGILKLPPPDGSFVVTIDRVADYLGKHVPAMVQAGRQQKQNPHLHRSGKADPLPLVFALEHSLPRSPASPASTLTPSGDPPSLPPLSSTCIRTTHLKQLQMMLSHNLRWIWIYGPPQIGKTTTMIMTLHRLSRTNRICYYIDLQLASLSEKISNKEHFTAISAETYRQLHLDPNLALRHFSDNNPAENQFINALKAGFRQLIANLRLRAKDSNQAPTPSEIFIGIDHIDRPSYGHDEQAGLPMALRQLANPPLIISGCRFGFLLGLSTAPTLMSDSNYISPPNHGDLLHLQPSPESEIISLARKFGIELQQDSLAAIEKAVGFHLKLCHDLFAACKARGTEVIPTIHTELAKSHNNIFTAHIDYVRCQMRKELLNSYHQISAGGQFLEPPNDDCLKLLRSHLLIKNPVTGHYEPSCQLYGQFLK
jgi:hypothetical protein